MEGLMFLTLCIIVGSGVVNVINESKQNEKSEVLEEKAHIKSKIDNIYVDGNGVLNKTYLAVFTLDDKEIKCVMNEKDYNSIPEGINGILTHKGTSFIKFNYDNKIIES